MKDILEKLSSYNIFNYLLPGVIFAAVGSSMSSFKLLADDIVVGVFLYYLYGLVISRLGSLMLEPLLKKVGFVRFAPYSDFVSASRLDTKIEILSEQNNMYRTLASTFLCLLFIAAADWLLLKFPGLTPYAYSIAVIALSALFTWSYRKQTNYISSRVNTTLESRKQDS